VKTYSEQDNGEAVTLAVGEAILLRLSENPTTGYRWHLLPWNHSILDVVRDEYRPGSESTFGAGGEHQWEFIAHHGGSVSVELAQYRSWEPAGHAPAFTLAVTVT